MNYKEIDNLIEKRQNEFKEISDKIWSYREPAFKEYKSSILQQDFLKDKGFTIENNLAGIETAFKARFGDSGPVIGFLGEFDALPGLSQEEDNPDKKEIEDGNNWGHGCGHNLLGTACMQSVVAIKEYLENNNIDGSVIYFGCPGEEGGAGKAFMQREKVFDEADIFLTWHPMSITAGAKGSLANARIYYRFKGVSSHAAVAPHLGRSALDSIELMNVGVNYLREHIIPEARIHYAVTNTGGTAPNVVQSYAEVLYAIRAPENDQLEELIERVNNIAKGAALMSGTDVEIQIVSAYANVLKNKTLDNLMYSHIKEIYPLEYDEKDYEYAERFYPYVDKNEIQNYKRMAKNYLDDYKDVLNGPLADIYFPPSNLKLGSTDVGDVSWNKPTSWFSGVTYTLGTPMHSYLAVAQGKSSIAIKGMSAAAKVMARTAIDVFEDNEIIKKAEEDFKNELDGREYKSMIPKDTTYGLI